MQDLGHHFWNKINVHSDTSKDKQNICMKQQYVNVHMSRFTFPLIPDKHKTSEKPVKSKDMM